MYSHSSTYRGIGVFDCEDDGGSEVGTNKVRIMGLESL